MTNSVPADNEHLAAIGATNGYRCECGDATGQQCRWRGPASETVVVEWMPEYLRASHAAAGNSGRWPANGALRLRVQRYCAELLTHEPTEDGECGEPSEWARIVEGA